jgi:4'-phosphopantetheinyl transferase
MPLPIPHVQWRTFAGQGSRLYARRGRIDVWLASTESARNAAVLDHCSEILSPQEIDACSAFHREEDRHRAFVSRALLRETLSRYAPIRPQDWEFAPGAHGKPAIAAPLGLRLRFNLSHAGGLVACALTLGDEIGVDLEDTSRALDPLELAEHVFSLDELTALRALAPASQRQRFFEIWTLKEAYLKARGLGFALAPQNARFDLGEPSRVRVRFMHEAEDRATDWWFALLNPQPGHTLALAARNGGRPERVRAFLSTPGAMQTRPIEPRLYAACLLPGPTP